VSAAPKILFFVTEDWYFWSHRLPLARAAKAARYQVTVVTRVQEYGDRIRAEGFKLIPLALQRRGSNPWQELRVIAQLVRIYRAERPDIVHHVAIKPVLYGSVAARFAHVRAIVNALAGLGYVFSSSQWKARLLRPFVKLAYHFLLNRANSRTIIQNPEDQRLLTDAVFLGPDKTVLIRGSGVDVDVFAPAPEPQGVPIIVMACRMLWDKGAREFVQAARLLHSARISARFVLVGKSDAENPTGIPISQLVEWQQRGDVEWWGYRSDMHKVLAQAHIVCLPSYREGLPKVLIEAAACGRAIVATDVPGCREIVRHGENGLLVPARDSGALAEALKQLILDPALRQRMGRRGREIAEAEFSIERINRETLALYRELLAQRART
jgi:glycosyltransferase involved in cell wall biosynthesis